MLSGSDRSEDAVSKPFPVFFPSGVGRSVAESLKAAAVVSSQQEAEPQRASTVILL